MPNFAQLKPPLVYRTKEAFQLAQLLYSELSFSNDLIGDNDFIVGKDRKPLFSYVVATAEETEELITYFTLQDGVIAILCCKELAPNHVTAICKNAEIAKSIAMKGQEAR